MITYNNIQVAYNNVFEYNMKLEPQSHIMCEIKLAGTEHNIKLDITASIYYKESANRNGIIQSQTESIYAYREDRIYKVILNVPDFPVKNVTKSFILIALDNNKSSYSKINIEYINIDTIKNVNVPTSTSAIIVPHDITDITQLKPLIVRSRIVGNGPGIYPGSICITNSKMLSIYSPKLAIASIVRDEESNGNLEKFLDCCQELEQYHKNILYIFIEGDSSDKTYDILRTWIENRNGSILEKIDMSYSPFIKDRNTIRTAYFAQLRNRIIEIILSMSDIHEILMIDASYEWKGDLITPLREVNTDIVAPLNVMHKDNNGNYLFYDVWVFRKNGKEFRWDYPYIEGMIFDKPSEVDSVGGGYMIKRKVLESGVRYNGDSDSEQVGFCQNARSLGFDIKINPNVYIKKNMVIV